MGKPDDAKSKIAGKPQPQTFTVGMRKTSKELYAVVTSDGTTETVLEGRSYPLSVAMNMARVALRKHVFENAGRSPAE